MSESFRTDRFQDLRRQGGLAAAVSLVCCALHCRDEAGHADEGGPPNRAEQSEFLQWAQRRADADLSGFLQWGLEKGLHSPVTETNVSLHHYAHDVGFECGEGKPRPVNGICSGAHLDPSGWIALMTWMIDDPSAASVEFTGYVRQPLTCDELKGAAVGKPYYDSHPRLVLRVCRLLDSDAIVSQLTPYDNSSHVRTRVVIYSDRMVAADPETAELVDSARRNAMRSR